MPDLILAHVLLRSVQNDRTPLVGWRKVHDSNRTVPSHTLHLLHQVEPRELHLFLVTLNHTQSLF